MSASVIICGHNFLNMRADRLLSLLLLLQARGRLTGREDPHDRVAATLATTVLALERGATVFRVHDVAETTDALKVAAATLRRDGP